MVYSYSLIPSSSSSSSIIPILITCSLLIPIAFSIDDTELGYICLPNNTAFTSDYNQSRALVVIDLIINTASSDGFMNATFSWPLQKPDERTYGLALCRGDVSPADCKTCVNNATLTLINTHCPDSRAAIIWRDYCFLKYSDDDFFGIIDTDNEFSSMGDIVWNLKTSSGAVKNFMVDLSKTAIQGPKLYAYGTSKIMDDLPYQDVTTVYGVAQCTRDLSPDDCQACLDSATTGLKTGKQGGRFVFGSCNIRYETYNFNSSATN